MKLLICGDSFAADWRQSFPDSKGWPTLLEKNFKVNNIAQAGCSEYKIFLQLKSVKLSNYDFIIVSHTSPYRLFVRSHPVHVEGMHKDSDLIYLDIKEHSKTTKELCSIVNFFENYVDLDYMIFVHNLICKEIDHYLEKHKVLHCTHFDWSNLYYFQDFLNFSNIVKNYSGNINHYNDEGNIIVYKEIFSKLQQKF